MATPTLAPWRIRNVCWKFWTNFGRRITTGKEHQFARGGWCSWITDLLQKKKKYIYIYIFFAFETFTSVKSKHPASEPELSPSSRRAQHDRSAHVSVTNAQHIARHVACHHNYFLSGKMHGLMIKHSWSQCFQKYFTSYLLYTVPESCRNSCTSRWKLRTSTSLFKQAKPRSKLFPQVINSVTWNIFSYRGRLIQHGQASEGHMKPFILDMKSFRLSKTWHAFFFPCFCVIPYCVRP